MRISLQSDWKWLGKFVSAKHAYVDDMHHPVASVAEKECWFVRCSLSTWQRVISSTVHVPCKLSAESCQEIVNFGSNALGTIGKQIECFITLAFVSLAVGWKTTVSSNTN